MGAINHWRSLAHMGVTTGGRLSRKNRDGWCGGPHSPSALMKVEVNAGEVTVTGGRVLLFQHVSFQQQVIVCRCIP